MARTTKIKPKSSKKIQFGKGSNKKGNLMSVFRYVCEFSVPYQKKNMVLVSNSKNSGAF